MAYGYEIQQIPRDTAADPLGGPVKGLALARCIARITHSSERDLGQKVPHPQDTAVAALLQQDGKALGQRFDANS